MRIASVENENGVSSLINSHFDKNEVVVDKIESIDEILFKDCSIYDLILVDMTHNRCLQFIQYIKQKTNIPVIYLTERYKKNPYEQELDDKDFVIHSYTREEFVYEVFKKVEEMSKKDVVDMGACVLDESSGVIKVGGQVLNLTKSEYVITTILIHNRRKIMSKEEIADIMVERELNTTPRSVREHIRKIRKTFERAKLEPIETVTGQGYRWTLDGVTTL